MLRCHSCISRLRMRDGCPKGVNGTVLMVMVVVGFDSVGSDVGNDNVDSVMVP